VRGGRPIWIFALLTACSSAPSTVTYGGMHLLLDSGEIEQGRELPMRIDHYGVRAVRSDAPWDGATLTFTYLGPTERDVALASGEIRRQVGLKLRAVDTCNVLYVMWWIEPARGVHVSVKHNPGASTHAECGARGYINLRPEESATPPAIEVGSTHRLSARIVERRLEVYADDILVWRGTLPSELPARGLVGMRSDNVRFEFSLERFEAPERAR